jgi:hypothetical protein
LPRQYAVSLVQLQARCDSDLAADNPSRASMPLVTQHGMEHRNIRSPKTLVHGPVFNRLQCLDPNTNFRQSRDLNNKVSSLGYFDGSGVR